MKTYEVSFNIITKADDEMLVDIRVNAGDRREAMQAAEAKLIKAIRAGADIRISGCREI